MTQKLLITGICGQTGSFLAKHMLEAGYEVHGTSRSAGMMSWRHSYLGIQGEIALHSVASDNYDAVKDLVSRKFEKIFHLAAESSVAASFKHPSQTVQANILHTTHWLEALRNIAPKTRFFNAASSEIFAPAKGQLSESSPSQATNPYAVTKLAAANMAKIFRDSFEIYVVNGVLFNHESELRDDRFVTAKIVNSIRALAQNASEPAVKLGNISAQRDFSYAGDVARGIAASLDHHSPEDYIFASGQLHSIQDFFDATARYFGFSPRWHGEGLGAVCTDTSSGRTLASISKEFFRPIDEIGKSGNPQKAKDILGWRPEHDFESIIKQMAKYGGLQRT